MTRRGLFSMLGLGGQASVDIPCLDKQGRPCAPRIVKPRNGECPVCGLDNGPVYDHATTIRNGEYWDEPIDTLVACKHCRAVIGIKSEFKAERVQPNWVIPLGGSNTHTKEKK